MDIKISTDSSKLKSIGTGQYCRRAGEKGNLGKSGEEVYKANIKWMKKLVVLVLLGADTFWWHLGLSGSGSLKKGEGYRYENGKD